MNPIFEKRSEGVKVYFSVRELKRKPIMFWNNVGNIHKYSKYNKWIKEVRRLVGQRTINGISHLSYYGGGRTLFPFHCNWMGDKFEFTLFDPFGNQLYNFGRNVMSRNERFTKEEINKLGKIMETHSHMNRSAYELFRKQEINNYNDVFKFKKNIEEILNQVNNQNQQ